MVGLVGFRMSSRSVSEPVPLLLWWTAAWQWPSPFGRLPRSPHRCSAASPATKCHKMAIDSSQKNHEKTWKRHGKNHHPPSDSRKKHEKTWKKTLKSIIHHHPPPSHPIPSGPIRSRTRVDSIKRSVSWERPCPRPCPRSAKISRSKCANASTPMRMPYPLVI